MRRYDLDVRIVVALRPLSPLSSHELALMDAANAKLSRLAKEHEEHIRRLADALGVLDD
jgi:hypothetical protein